MIALTEFYAEPGTPMKVCPSCDKYAVKHGEREFWVRPPKDFNPAGKVIYYLTCPKCRQQKKSAAIIL